LPPERSRMGVSIATGQTFQFQVYAEPQLREP